MNKDKAYILAFIEDLNDSVESGQLSIDQALRLLIQLFQAVAESAGAFSPWRPKTWDLTKAMRALADNRARALGFKRYSAARKLDAAPN